MFKIMKKISTIELISLNGGSASHDCMWYLQYEANTHVSSGNQKMEDAYWDKWSDRFEECAGA